MIAKERTAPYISADEISSICKKLGQQIERDYAGKDLLVICVLKGSFIFTADLVRKIDLPLQMDFIRLSSYGDKMESSGQIQLNMDLSTDIKGKHVLVAEDILDTGHTLTFLKKLLLSRQPASLKLCVLLDKPARRAAPIEADYVGKAIEDKFVIGYGLDYQEKHRNHPDILYVK